MSSRVRGQTFQWFSFVVRAVMAEVISAKFRTWVQKKLQSLKVCRALQPLVSGGECQTALILLAPGRIPASTCWNP